ncbi:thyrotropin-releasing hormone receptor-like [Brachionus plicatilis]|uniref:Thyrotropin-releasing hormone receptor-like n=1 Tax=Brachionus plicatilis TaxID=10195 RepID=A0A3M7S1M9_BRAPC|nr:thyrotropin-releasing hormone receptor-like [Brachionus plicatilis]
MIDFDYSKNTFEYYLIPVCFVVGFVGNTFGSICILSNQKFRQRTPLFIQASIGLSDTFLLISQIQRWLAVFSDQRVFLINNSLCKVYFMILRSSILISSVLTFFLPLIRFISLYLGNFRLSTYSNLGQICSRLSVAYILSISFSLSWHELWTSGLKNGDDPLLVAEPDYESDLAETTTRLMVQQNLKCHKNVISYSIIHAINLIYFFILFSMYSGSIVLSFFLYLKMNSAKNVRDWNSQKPKSKSCSLPVNRPTSSLDHFNRKTFSLGEISGHSLKFVFTKNIPVRPKKFTMYICVVSAISAAFCLPYAILDLSYYKDAQVNFSQNHTNSSTETSYSLNRLPLLLIIVPHCIKFYLLFFFYPKFRRQMGNFLKLRLYVDFPMMRKQFKARPVHVNNSSGCCRKKIKFVVVNQLNFGKDNQPVIQKSRRKNLKKDYQIYAGLNGGRRCAGSESESSSIMGYNIFPNINRPMLSLCNTGNYIEAYDFDLVNLPMVSSPAKKKISSSSTFDFIDKSKCISNSNSSITIEK